MKIIQKEVITRLKQLSGWHLDSTAIVKEFEFKDFKQAFEFMSRCAMIADEIQHHPEWSNTYNKVVVRLTTHSKSGLTEKDFELAERMNKIQEDVTEHLQ